MTEYRFDPVTFTIVEGDILDLDVEAVVNAANERLQHGGGLAGQIVARGGWVIQEESDRIGHCPVGTSCMTGAGSLNANWVIHSVGPRWGEGNEEKKLTGAVESALMLAEEKEISSLAMPAISTGIFGYPLGEAARVILTTIGETAPFLVKLRRIVLCLRGERTCTIFRGKAGDICG